MNSGARATLNGAAAGARERRRCDPPDNRQAKEGKDILGDGAAAPGSHASASRRAGFPAATENARAAASLLMPLGGNCLACFLYGLRRIIATTSTLALLGRVPRPPGPATPSRQSEWSASRQGCPGPGLLPRGGACQGRRPLMAPSCRPPIGNRSLRGGGRAENPHGPLGSRVRPLKP